MKYIPSILYSLFIFLTMQLYKYHSSSYAANVTVQYTVYCNYKLNNMVGCFDNRYSSNRNVWIDEKYFNNIYIRSSCTPITTFDISQNKFHTCIPYYDNLRPNNSYNTQVQQILNFYLQLPSTHLNYNKYAIIYKLLLFISPVICRDDVMIFEYDTLRSMLQLFNSNYDVSVSIENKDILSEFTIKNGIYNDKLSDIEFEIDKHEIIMIYHIQKILTASELHKFFDYIKILILLCPELTDKLSNYNSHNLYDDFYLKIHLKLNNMPSQPIIETTTSLTQELKDNVTNAHQIHELQTKDNEIKCLQQLHALATAELNKQTMMLKLKQQQYSDSKIAHSKELEYKDNDIKHLKELFTKDNEINKLKIELLELQLKKLI